MTRDEKLRAKIEAALFMSNQPVTLERMSKMFKTDQERIKEAIAEFKPEFDKTEHGIYVLETPSGYQIRVKPEYINSVGTLTPYKELSRGLLRVLALVAYKQPITQSEIVKVMGNRTYEYVKKLVERGMIKTERHSRTKALVATKEFANYFGLEKPEDAKKFFENLEVEAKDIEKDEKVLEEVEEDYEAYHGKV
jgi:segregation and condensation protein B